MSVSIHRDPRSQYVRRLNLAFRQGHLNVFVGAGVSQEAGFPGWEAFNQGLMHTYLMSDIGSAGPAAMLASSSIEPTANELYGALGREAVADFVYRAVGKRFGSLLASVLYSGRGINDLPLKSVHHQIAALAQKARLFTLNFDLLLECALCRKFSKKNWVDFRSPKSDGKALTGKYKVEHLHGWIDPDGKMSPDIVLTESHYLDLTEDSRARANKILKTMLGGHNTTLILGMSLADPNFRRVLYFLHKQQRSSRERIYVVTRQAKPAIDHYAQRHWVSRGLRLLFVEQHDEIPGLLRDIQWGEAAPEEMPRWVSESISWRVKRLPDLAIFTDPWQKAAYESLHALSQKVMNLFGPPREERLEFGLMIPFADSKTNARLRMVASSRKFVPHDRALFRANKRVLSIKKGQEQGIAGVCFSTGTIRTVAFGEGEVDINFTPSMLETWISSKGYRDWRSIISVPVIDTEHWIPVAVITLTSNMPSPFWKEFGAKQSLLEPELYTAMRSTAHFCLVDLLPGLLSSIK